MKKQTWRLIFLLSTFHSDKGITWCKCLNEILDCKRMMFGKLWKELWSFYAGHWWLFRITKTWSENRQQVKNFQFLVSKLSIARQNAVGQRNNILTDRNCIWFCGKSSGWHHLTNKVQHCAVCYTAAGSVNSYKRVDIWPSNFPFHSCTSHFVATITHIVSNQKVIRTCNKKK